MNILITGARGFIGKNLVLLLRERKHTVFEYDIETSPDRLEEFVAQANFIVHLAGANRPRFKEEFSSINRDFTEVLIKTIVTAKNNCPIIFSSSIQAGLDNDYGKSKKQAEEMFFLLQKEHPNKIYVFRLSNVFGKWSKPNYNSVVSTFCYNIARNLPIYIADPLIEIPLVYIDDVTDCFIDIIEGKKKLDSSIIHEVQPIYRITLGDLAEQIWDFKQSRMSLFLPNTQNPLILRLYSTYTSFLPQDDLKYDLKMNIDARGSFTEFLKTEKNGQIAINVCKPGITKGNHYHHTKNEKFLVVSGTAEIKLRKVNEKDVFSYTVSGEKMTVVDIPPGYSHSITNIGFFDLVTIMWSSPSYDKDFPDTYFQEV